MITLLQISNFKSVKRLELECRRINLFIGEPNTGKSNILEALGLWSAMAYGKGPYGEARDFVRFERTLNLFYDEAVEEGVGVRCDDLLLTLHEEMGQFKGLLQRSYHSLFHPLDRSGRPVDIPSDLVLTGDQRNILPTREYSAFDAPEAEQVKFYRFRTMSTFDEPASNFLMPPSGANLLSLLVANRDLRSIVSESFRARGLRLGLRPQEGKLELIKSLEDDIIISYPYALASETLQRLTFHLAAILSNRNSVLVFEEPESHSFPYHTKFLAEQIALDENQNQYFIATHNPYFLLPVLEKSNEEDVAIHIVYYEDYEDYETRTKRLPAEDLQDLAEIDVFTNLEKYLSA